MKIIRVDVQETIWINLYKAILNTHGLKYNNMFFENPLHYF